MSEKLIALAQEHAALYRLFSNPCRLMILWSLDEGELAVGEIAKRVGSTMQNVSQHLRLLREHDLITARRDGHYIYYRINHGLWLDRSRVMAKHPEVAHQNDRIPQPYGGT